MARPLRIEFDGAYYHVLSRGNNKSSIFREEEDYRDFLDLLDQMNDRFSIDIYAYVLMGNHYHLLLQTRYGNLSKAMHWLGDIGDVVDKLYKLITLALLFVPHLMSNSQLSRRCH